MEPLKDFYSVMDAKEIKVEINLDCNDQYKEENSYFNVYEDIKLEITDNYLSVDKDPDTTDIENQKNNSNKNSNIIENKLHINDIHLNNIIKEKDKICNNFTTKEKLQKHMAKHKEWLQCDLCFFRFRTKNAIINHMYVHKIYNFKCSLCNFKTKYKNNLNRHIKRYHESKNSEVSKKESQRNSIKSSTKNYLEKHKKFHDEHKKFQCWFCSCQYLTMERLEQHMIDHSDKIFYCDQCNYKTKHKGNLKFHITKHVELSAAINNEINIDLTQTKSKSGNEKDLYKICNLCNFKTQKILAYTRHRRLHDKNRKYVCNICQFRFPFNRDLKRHMSKHTDEKYVCYMCNTQFNHKKNLIAHVAIHEGKKYICTVCGFECFSMRQLTSHRSYKHTKNVQCHFCFKLFTQSMLVQHLKECERFLLEEKSENYNKSSN